MVASPIFTETNGFMTDPDLTSLGLIQVSYLWPGKTDLRTRAQEQRQHLIMAVTSLSKFYGM